MIEGVHDEVVPNFSSPCSHLDMLSVVVDHVHTFDCNAKHDPLDIAVQQHVAASAQDHQGL